MIMVQKWPFDGWQWVIRILTLWWIANSWNPQQLSEGRRPHNVQQSVDLSPRVVFARVIPRTKGKSTKLAQPFYNTMNNFFTPYVFTSSKDSARCFCNRYSQASRQLSSITHLLWTTSSRIKSAKLLEAPPKHCRMQTCAGNLSRNNGSIELFQR